MIFLPCWSTIYYQIHPYVSIPTHNTVTVRILIHTYTHTKEQVHKVGGTPMNEQSICLVYLSVSYSNTPHMITHSSYSKWSLSRCYSVCSPLTAWWITACSDLWPLQCVGYIVETGEKWDDVQLGWRWCHTRALGFKTHRGFVSVASTRVCTQSGNW